MVNTVELIGRLVADPVVKTLEDGIKVSSIRLAVTRPFKNGNGEFDVDFIPITFWYGAAQLAEQYCGKGDLIFVRGRVVNKVQVINETNYHFTEIIGDRLVLLCHKFKQDSNEEHEDPLKVLI